MPDACYYTSEYHIYPLERNVYHDNVGCWAGQQIEDTHIRDGKGAPGETRRLCHLCGPTRDVKAIHERIDNVLKDLGR